MTKDSLTTDQAIAMYRSGWWTGMKAHDVVMFQLHEPRICMPIRVLVDFLQEVLGRPVWAHELCQMGALRAEFMGDRPAPAFAEIAMLIPEDKRILIQID
jgi:hypothetical protein